MKVVESSKDVVKFLSKVIIPSLKFPSVVNMFVTCKLDKLTEVLLVIFTVKVLEMVLLKGILPKLKSLSIILLSASKTSIIGTSKVDLENSALLALVKSFCCSPCALVIVSNIK